MTFCEELVGGVPQSMQTTFQEKFLPQKCETFVVISYIRPRHQQGWESVNVQPQKVPPKTFFVLGGGGGGGCTRSHPKMAFGEANFPKNLDTTRPPKNVFLRKNSLTAKTKNQHKIPEQGCGIVMKEIPLLP